MDNEQPCNPWREARRIIGIGSASEVLALACPQCGGALRVHFHPGDPTIKFPTRLRFAAINIRCTQCTAKLCADGCDVHPPWVEELGPNITTRPLPNS